MATKQSKPRKQARTKRTKAAPKPENADALKKIKAIYPHVQSVVSTGKRGQATRVVIGCTAKYDGCEETRECASQDAFQVVRCHSCQREYLKRRRRANAPENPRAAAAA